MPSETLAPTATTRTAQRVTAASSSQKESERYLPGLVRLRKRSTEMNPSTVSRTGFSSAAMSR